MTAWATAARTLPNRAPWPAVPKLKAADRAFCQSPPLDSICRTAPQTRQMLLASTALLGEAVSGWSKDTLASGFSHRKRRFYLL